MSKRRRRYKRGLRAKVNKRKWEHRPFHLVIQNGEPRGFVYVTWYSPRVRIGRQGQTVAEAIRGIRDEIRLYNQGRQRERQRRAT